MIRRKFFLMVGSDWRRGISKLTENSKIRQEAVLKRRHQFGNRRCSMINAERSSAHFTPSHQFPSGVVMSMARRLELLDDYASEFRYGGHPLASLQGLKGGDRVIYTGTLNKALFPGLRLGYAVVPPRLLERAVTTRYLMDRHPPLLQQSVAAEFIQGGYLAAHIRRMRQLYRGQRDVLVSGLRRRLDGIVTVDPPDQGMHLVAYLAKGYSDVAVEKAAKQRGVLVRALSTMFVAAPPRHGLMLGFSGYPKQMIAPAVSKLVSVFENRLLADF